MISRKRGDDIYIGGRPQKEIRKKQDADGNENLVEPDISVICDPEKIDEKGMSWRAGLGYRDRVTVQQVNRLRQEAGVISFKWRERILDR